MAQPPFRARSSEQVQHKTLLLWHTDDYDRSVPEIGVLKILDLEIKMGDMNTGHSHKDIVEHMY